MPNQQGGVYQRGPFWLDYARGRDGEPVSPNFYVWWYDGDRGRQRRLTTGCADVRSACDRLDAHYLATLKPTDATRAAYTLPDALVDYYNEHGSAAASAEAIKARLAHVHRFIVREMKAGRLSEPVMVEAADEGFLVRFREWMIAEPIVARRKGPRGEWRAGAARPRSPATVEESIVALKAALNHAYGARCIAYVPPIKLRTRGEVTAVRNDRISVAALGEMFDYTMRGARQSGHAGRLLPLRRYLIAAVTTLARPDAICDMSVIEARAQWLRHDRRYALNPAGRVQTKKYRPVVPVGELLELWLGVTDEWWLCMERARRDDDGEPLLDRFGKALIEQAAVKSVRSAWDTMRLALKTPPTWGLKLLRHSMATELRKRRVDPWELAGQLGHRTLRTTETYAAFAPDYLGTVQAGIADVVADLAKAAGPALHPNLTQEHGNVAVLAAARNG